ncbi:Imm26 family immunity protein [Lacibacter sp. H407]|jgi:hypothetical protein|uniref:Imm26 family immunity protein n=1 Tax=Lacibacter sp. H407 TaxID=3133423 RepID=UPI0030C3CAB6
MAATFLNKLISGDIYEVPLLKSYGFCYVKLIKYELIFNDVHIIKVLVNPLNRFDKTRLKNIKELEKISEYAFSPILLLGSPKLRGENSWRFITNVALTNSELLIPDFKITYEINDLFNSTKSFSDLQWYKVAQLNASNSTKSKYNEVRELGFFSEMNCLLIIYKLTILWILQNGRNVEDYFSEDERNQILGFTVAYQLASLEFHNR